MIVCSTMSCNYYMINLKNGQIEAKISGRGKYAVELVRAPVRTASVPMPQVE